MFKQAASVVLTSLRGAICRNIRFASSLAAAWFAERRVLARRGWVGENDGLFEHPAEIYTSQPQVWILNAVNVG